MDAHLLSFEDARIQVLSGPNHKDVQSCTHVSKAWDHNVVAPVLNSVCTKPVPVVPGQKPQMGKTTAVCPASVQLHNHLQLKARLQPESLL